MITFQDGPAQGQKLELAVAPILLRVVCGPGGKWDALDQLDDTAAPEEQIWLYELSSVPQLMHLCCQPRSKSRWVTSAHYRQCPEPVMDGTLRDNQRFVEWCMENKERILTRRKSDGWNENVIERRR